MRFFKTNFDLGLAFNSFNLDLTVKSNYIYLRHMIVVFIIILYNYYFIILFIYFINFYHYLQTYNNLYKPFKTMNYIKIFFNNNLSFKNNNNNKLKIFY